MISFKWLVAYDEINYNRSLRDVATVDVAGIFAEAEMAGAMAFRPPAGGSRRIAKKQAMPIV